MKAIFFIVSAGILSACATTSALDSAIESGAKVVEGGYMTLIGDTGATYKETNGAWVNYLSADGQKIVKINKTGEVKELAWRLNETGQFCQELFSSGKESCFGEDSYITEYPDGTYSIISNGKQQPYRFTVTEGNPENL